MSVLEVGVPSFTIALVFSDPRHSPIYCMKSLANIVVLNPSSLFDFNIGFAQQFSKARLYS